MVDWSLFITSTKILKKQPQPGCKPCKVRLDREISVRVEEKDTFFATDVFVTTAVPFRKRPRFVGGDSRFAVAACKTKDDVEQGLQIVAIQMTSLPARIEQIVRHKRPSAGVVDNIECRVFVQIFNARRKVEII